MKKTLVAIIIPTVHTGHKEIRLLIHFEYKLSDGAKIYSLHYLSM